MRTGTFDHRRASGSSPNWLVWGGLFALAATMFLRRIGHEPLWLDETYSFAMIGHGLADIVRLTTKDVHPPLYYLLLKLWSLLFGTSPTALRVPSALAALALVAHGAFAVRRIWGARTSYIYALLVATSPGIVSFAQEARMYTLAAFFVTGAVLYGYLAMVEGRRRDLVWFAVFTWAAAMTHYFGLVAVAINGVLLMARSQNRSQVKPVAKAVLIAAVLYSPWLVPLALQVARVSRGFWIPPTSFDLIMFGLVAPFAYKFEDIPYPWQANVAIAIVAAVAIAASMVKTGREPMPASRGRLLLLMVYALTFGFGLAFSKIVEPVFMPRYMLVCAGLLLLVAASAIAALPRLGHSVAVAGCLIGLGLPASLRIQTQTFSGPFTELAAQVQRSGDREPVLLHNDIQAILPSWHAIPHARHVMVISKGGSWEPLGAGVYPGERLAAIQDIGTVLSQTKCVWIVDASPAGFHLDPAKIVAHPGWKQTGPTLDLDLPMSWVKVRLSRFEGAEISMVLRSQATRSPRWR